MPKFVSADDQIINVPTGNFQFSAVRIEKLGATEYTIVTVVRDISGSVVAYAKELDDCLKSIVEACKKNPRAENLLVRVVDFNSNVNEVHGFKELITIDPNDYAPVSPSGMTALYGGTFNAVVATLEYSKKLTEKDFSANGAIYIITDGMDNIGGMTPTEIGKRIGEALKNEYLESLISILIGININEPEAKRHLDTFKKEAGLTEFIDIGDASPKKLAKLGRFISESISSQSQALGTGAPSQSLTF